LFLPVTLFIFLIFLLTFKNCNINIVDTLVLVSEKTHNVFYFLIKL